MSSHAGVIAACYSLSERTVEALALAQSSESILGGREHADHFKARIGPSCQSCRLQYHRNSSYLEQTWPAWPQLAPTAGVPSSWKLQGFRREVRTSTFYCRDVPRFVDCKIPTSTSGRPAQIPFLDFRLHHHLLSDSANRYGHRSLRALLRQQYCLQKNLAETAAFR